MVKDRFQCKQIAMDSNENVYDVEQWPVPMTYTHADLLIPNGSFSFGQLL